MKRAAIFILSLLLLCLCLCACARGTESVPEQDSPSQTTAENAAPVNADILETLSFFKDIQYYEQWEGDMLLCRVEFPVLLMDSVQAKGYAVSGAVDALNARLATSAQDTYTKLLNSVRGDIELNVENASNYLSNTDAFLLRADSRALSVLLRTEAFTGGMSNSISFSCTNFDSRTGQELALRNVADVSVLTPIIKEALEAKYPKVEFYGLDTTLEGYIQDPSRYVWTLDYQGVSFYFAPYELAPGEAGCLSVGLRYEDYPQLFSLYYSRQPYSYAVPMVEGQCLNYDVNMDGASDEISLVPHREKGSITKLDICVNSRTMSVNAGMESYESYVVYAGLGRSYLFINAHSSSGYGYVSVYRLEQGGASLVGMLYDTSLQAAGFTAECAGIPLLTKPENIILGTKLELLGTLTGVKNYFIGSSGMPESADEYYRVYANTTLTAKTGFATAAIDPDTGRGLNSAAKIEPGTRMYYLRSDGRSFVDMMSEDGLCCRMYVSGKGAAQTVNGMPVADCFDGVIYS